MNDDFDSSLEDFPSSDLSDLDGLFPDLNKALKPQPKPSPSAHATRKSPSMANQLNWTETRPIARFRDEAVVCLICIVTCEICGTQSRYVEGIFLRRTHLHHSPVTELQAIALTFGFPPLPKETQYSYKPAPICDSCLHLQGFSL